MASNIAEFYKNKNIFITGGTGFVGIALVEKILRSCPDVKKVPVRSVRHIQFFIFFFYDEGLSAYEAQKGKRDS